MKLHLPKSISSYKAFTLIELMVVVAIIAILAVIGFAIFQNAQANARNGIRRGEVNNLAKSIETTKDPTAANYLYQTTDFTADYPQNTPKDPRKLAGDAQYCVATSATLAALPGIPTSWGTAPCPAAPLGYSVIVDNAGSYVTAGNALATGIRYWRICSKLELTTGYFCLANAQ